VANEFANGCGEKANYLRGALEEFRLRRVYPVAWKVGVVIDTETVRKNNVLEATGFADALVLWTVTL
jgi:hypothetical protein